MHNEIAALRRFQHPHIVSYFGCDTSASTVTIFME
jgi:hypothetical protein